MGWGRGGGGDSDRTRHSGSSGQAPTLSHAIYGVIHHNVDYSIHTAYAYSTSVLMLHGGQVVPQNSHLSPDLQQYHIVT